MHTPVNIIMKKTIFALLLFPFLIGCQKHQTGHEEQVHAAKNSGDPVTLMMDGNKRFTSHQAVHPDATEARQKEIAEHQSPFAAVVCCSDSRVPPEIIFDQGLGDLFVIRTAGNLIGDIELGSLEYALEHLKVKAVMVLGHESCGVIKAFLSEEEEHGNIGNLVNLVKSEEEESAAINLPGDKVNNCVLANIDHGVKQIKSTFHEFLQKQENTDVKIIGAEYDLNSGKVDIVFN